MYVCSYDENGHVSLIGTHSINYKCWAVPRVCCSQCRDRVVQMLLVVRQTHDSRRSPARQTLRSRRDLWSTRCCSISQHDLSPHNVSRRGNTVLAAVHSETSLATVLPFPQHTHSEKQHPHSIGPLTRSTPRLDHSGTWRRERRAPPELPPNARE